jgi:hypothetical protein
MSQEKLYRFDIGKTAGCIKQILKTMAKQL